MARLDGMDAQRCLQHSVVADEIAGLTFVGAHAGVFECLRTRKQKALQRRKQELDVCDFAFTDLVDRGRIRLRTRTPPA